MASKYEQIKKDFLSGRLKGCKKYFESHKYYIEAGYCDIILDNLKKAYENFEKVGDSDIRAHWGKFLIQMIRGEISTTPTYFEIRNFLEIDLSILITYCKGDYIEKIVKYADYMAIYNLECYKFFGRVFWAHNFMPAAMFFLQRAKERLFKDPELHYQLAYIYYTQKDLDKCKKEIDTCLNILPLYAPAEKLKTIIQKG